MRTIPTLARAACVLVLGGVVVLEAVRTTAQDHPQPGPREWPMTALEREQREDILTLDSSLGPVVSGNAAAADIVHRAYREGWKDATMCLEAERRLGVAVVPSGLSWVSKK